MPHSPRCPRGGIRGGPQWQQTRRSAHSPPTSSHTQADAPQPSSRSLSVLLPLGTGARGIVPRPPRRPPLLPHHPLRVPCTLPSVLSAPFRSQPPFPSRTPGSRIFSEQTPSQKVGFQSSGGTESRGCVHRKPRLGQIRGSPRQEDGHQVRLVISPGLHASAPPVSHFSA